MISSNVNPLIRRRREGRLGQAPSAGPGPVRPANADVLMSALKEYTGLPLEAGLPSEPDGVGGPFLNCQKAFRRGDPGTEKIEARI